jgi:Lectin C-type domain
MSIGQYINSFDTSGMSHTEAVALATARGGTLAAVTTTEENNLILGFLAEDDLLRSFEPKDNARSGPWIGLTQPPESAEPLGGWTWDNGETFCFSYWHSGQPDNFVNDNYVLYWDYPGTIGWADSIDDITTANLTMRQARLPPSSLPRP